MSIDTKIIVVLFLCWAMCAGWWFVYAVIAWVREYKRRKDGWTG